MKSTSKRKISVMYTTSTMIHWGTAPLGCHPCHFPRKASEGSVKLTERAFKALCFYPLPRWTCTASEHRRAHFRKKRPLNKNKIIKHTAVLLSAGAFDFGKRQWHNWFWAVKSSLCFQTHKRNKQRLCKLKFAAFAQAWRCVRAHKVKADLLSHTGLRCYVLSVLLSQLNKNQLELDF